MNDDDPRLLDRVAALVLALVLAQVALVMAHHAGVMVEVAVQVVGAVAGWAATRLLDETRGRDG
jgi:hypothetical protein